MANWKKVIVSGSNAELNHITASGNISASGFLFGNLPQGTTSEVVIYNTATGRLEFKELNLVAAQRAPELFVIDIDNGDDGGSQQFRLSFDTGSAVTSFPITPIVKLSASLNPDGGDFTDSVSHLSYPTINETFDGAALSQETYFDPSDGSISPVGAKTGSRSEGNNPGPDDVRSHLITGGSKIDVVLYAQQSIGTAGSSTAVPAQAGPAYGARAFDVPPGTSTDTGSIQVYLNDMGTPVATFILTGSNNPAITHTAGGVVATISRSGSAQTTAGDIDTLKSFRSASFTIQASAQNDGFNYAYLLYTGSRGDGTEQVRALTNFIQWFYDTDGHGENMDDTAIPDSDVNLSGIDGSDTLSVSGIKYLTSESADSAALTIAVSQSNQYRNIYGPDLSNQKGLQFNYPAGAGIDSISITQTGSHVLNHPVVTNPSNTNGVEVSLAPLDKTVTDAYLQDTKLTASLGIDFSDMSNNVHHPATFLEGATRPWGTLSNNLDITFNVDFQHPNKSGGEKTRAITDIDSYLVDTQNPLATVNNFEDFRRERFRIKSNAYSNFTDPTTSGDAWDSTKNVVDGGTGFDGGLLQYASYLCYPKYPGLSADPGNFTTTYGPTQTHDYSSGGGSEATGEREYYRYFTLTSEANGATQLNIEFSGSGSLCRDGNTTSFVTGQSGFKVFVNRTGGGSNSVYNGTFVNAVNNKVGTTLADQDSIPVTTTVDYSDSATQVTGTGTTFVPQGIVKISDDNANSYSAGQFVIVKIVTPQDWSGYINAMAITFGNTAQSNRLLGNTYSTL